MSTKVKAVLTVSLKNAVNAVLTNAGLMAKFHDTFYLTGNWSGIRNMAWVTLIVVAAREGMVWMPKLLSWSMSPTPGVDS